MSTPGPPLPCQSPVPAGLRLRPDSGLQTLAGGAVLVGGSPLRLLRLGPRGATLVCGWWEGRPVPGRPAAQALARRLLDTGMAHPDPDGGPGPEEVTVVIPVRDRPGELARCLAALTGRPDPPGPSGPPGPPGSPHPPGSPGPRGLRVIVVDDGSVDAGAIARAAAAAGARLLRRDRSGGPGAARNTGLAAVRTPLVAFVDSDCVPGPGWLLPLLQHFADPAVGAVAPRIVAHEQGTGWLARYEEVRSALDMGLTESIVRPGARVPYVPGAALIVRRRAAAIGFAEDMPVGEDVDFIWRLSAAGWHIRYEPRAAVGHQHRVRPGEWLRRRRDYGTSAAPLELRHPGTVPACAMSGWSALAWLAVAARRPGTGAAIAGAATVVLARRLSPLTDEAWPLAGRLAAGGTLAAGPPPARAPARTPGPLGLAGAVAAPPLSPRPAGPPHWSPHPQRPTATPGLAPPCEAAPTSNAPRAPTTPSARPSSTAGQQSQPACSHPNHPSYFSDGPLGGVRARREQCLGPYLSL